MTETFKRHSEYETNMVIGSTGKYYHNATETLFKIIEEQLCGFRYPRAQYVRQQLV